MGLAWMQSMNSRSRWGDGKILSNSRRSIPGWTTKRSYPRLNSSRHRTCKLDCVKQLKCLKSQSGNT